MNLSCYLVDDEFHALEVLRSYVARTPGLELKGSNTDPLAALDEVASADPPQITFLDVDMPELSGMEFAGMVSLYTKVIFTTSYPEYAVEAFEKEAADYLLKPISYERFLKSVQRIRRLCLEKGQGISPDPGYFYIKTEQKGKFLKINTADIIYLEAAQNYVSLHCRSGTHLAYLTMEEIGQRLPADRFLRVHRSFIVCLERVRTLEYGRLTLDDKTVIPLGDAYKEPLLSAMKQLLIESRRNSGGGSFKNSEL